MTDIHIYPSDDLHYITGTGRILHSPNHRPQIVSAASGRYSSLSLRSLPPNFEDLDDGGAEIPDIPLRRSGKAKGKKTKMETSGITPLAQILAGGKEFLVTHSRPINPNDIQRRAEQEKQEADVMTMDAELKRPMSPEPDVEDDCLTIETRTPSTYPRSMRSRATVSTYQTNDTSLPALQTKGAADEDLLEPLLEEEIDPGSFDLVIPAHGDGGLYSLEKRSDLLFSKEHLQVIFSDPALLQHFTAYLCTNRPSSVPLLIYYLDALKALKAIIYSNAVIEALDSLEGHEFSQNSAAKTLNDSLQAKADAAFEAMARDDLPAYITHVWIQTVSLSIKRRIAGTLPAHLRDMSEGLAEVFCLTDPSRHDNPIVFASEEFHRTTQYGMNYVLGRNCRFLQGPRTNASSVKRIRDRLAAGKEHYETFLNYRRDGSPFMNLLMIAPLYDSRGTIRYFIGAQVDVSGLAKDCSGLESLRRLVEEDELKGDRAKAAPPDDEPDKSKEKTYAAPKPDEFRDLAEMFNLHELESVRKNGGNMHRLPQVHEEAQHAEATSNWHKPRILIQDSASSIHNTNVKPDSHPHGYPTTTSPSHPSGGTIDPSSGRLTGVYEHYLLVRPYPSLRILFASPSLRVPGILQSSFLARVGGSPRVRDELTAALAEGHGVTAKVRWLTSTRGGAGEGGGRGGRPRWIHCTPLLGSNGAIGVWMVVIVDDEEAPGPRRGKEAPPVPARREAGVRRGSYHARKPAIDDTMSLREFAAQGRLVVGERNGVPGVGGGGGMGREAARSRSALALQDGLGDESFDDTRPSSPYTLRIGED